MDFSINIDTFKKTGDYSYQIDAGGNLFLNAQSDQFNQHYISLPLSNISYSIDKINSFYPSTFSEFVNVTSNTESSSVDLKSQLSTKEAENDTLKQKLNDIILAQQSNNPKADELAVKQLVIALRISLNQGSSEADFNSIFPYFPLK